MSESENQPPALASKIQQLRNKFHNQTDQENGLYLNYGRTTGGIKGGVKKIMELLKIPNLHSISTKLNNEGGIDILGLNFKPTPKQASHTVSRRTNPPCRSAKFKYLELQEYYK